MYVRDSCACVCQSSGTILPLFFSRHFIYFSLSYLATFFLNVLQLLQPNDWLKQLTRGRLYFWLTAWEGTTHHGGDDAVEGRLSAAGTRGSWLNYTKKQRKLQRKPGPNTTCYQQPPSFVSQRFCNLPVQWHQLGTMWSNAWAYRVTFHMLTIATFNPSLGKQTKKTGWFLKRLLNVTGEGLVKSHQGTPCNFCPT